MLGCAGRGRYVLEEEDIALKPGTLIWAPCGSAHMLLEAGGHFDMWVVLAHPKLWRTAPRHFSLTKGGGARQLAPQAAEELSALAAVLETCETTERGTGLRWWLTRARQLWSQSDAGGAALWHPAVARAAHLIARAPHLPLPAIAKQAGLSQSRLSAIFQQQTGQTITAFRNARRLEAVDRAVSAKTPLLTAALDAGFGSYSQFYRVFQAERAANPRAWYGNSD